VNARRELAILNAVSEALNSSPDVRKALERTLSLVADLLGLRTGWVWLLDQETDRFYDAAERELPPYLQERVRMAGRRRCWCIDDFRDGELTPTNIDVMECSRLQPAFRGKSAALAAGLRYHASIPLYFQDKRLGIMNVTGPEWRKLTTAELRLLSTIAYQVGISIERARLAEDATRLARAEERTRMAREIHDTLAQGFVGISSQLDAVAMCLPDEKSSARKYLDLARRMARHSLTEARRSVMDLRASALEGQDLAAAIEAGTRMWTAGSGVHVDVMVEAAAPCELPQEMEQHLLRIAQEAVTNVLKHAEASKIWVKLNMEARKLNLRIVDNGRGFEQEDVFQSRGGHFGLMGMRERAERLGGELHLSSHPGEGTKVEVVVPLP
jgi:two-component system NarL family sensor kinase